MTRLRWRCISKVHVLLQINWLRFLPFFTGEPHSVTYHLTRLPIPQKRWVSFWKAPYAKLFSESKRVVLIMVGFNCYNPPFVGGRF